MMHMPNFLTFVSSLTAASGTVAITATNPDLTPFSNTSSVSWLVLLQVTGSGYSWTLRVQPAASTFTSCPNIPISQVKMTCTSITDTALIGGSTKSCGSAFNLSSSSQVLASGTDPLIGLLFTRTLNYQLSYSDSWQYAATTSPCTITLNFSLTAS
jgi:hypothetical protein